MFAGFLLGSAGCIGAIAAPVLMEGFTADALATPQLSSANLSSATTGDSRYVVSMKVSSKNKTHEKGVVYGNRYEYERYKDNKGNKKYAWRHKQSYGDGFKAWSSDLGFASVSMIGNVSPSGDKVFRHETDSVRITGLKVDDPVTMVVGIGQKKPLQLNAQEIFVGSYSEWKTHSEETGETTSLILMGMGALMTLIGFIMFVSGIFMKSD